MKKGSKILGRVVSFGIMVLSIYLILGVYIMKDEFYIFGYRPVVVLSGSMEPYMQTNSVAVLYIWVQTRGSFVWLNGALHADKFCGYHPENKRH